MTGTGNISEADVKVASGNENSIIVGFGIDVDKQADIMSKRMETSVNTFKVIYDLIEWIEKEIESKRPRIETEETTGKAKILKAFSATKNSSVLGARVLEGKILVNKEVKILRRGEEIGRGKLKNYKAKNLKFLKWKKGLSLDYKLKQNWKLYLVMKLKTLRK